MALRRLLSAEHHNPSKKPRSMSPVQPEVPISSPGSSACLQDQPSNVPHIPKQFTIEYMTETEMILNRVALSKKRAYMQAVFKCSACVVSFNTQSELKNHLERKHTPRPNGLKCSICTTYVSRQELNEHRRRHYIKHYVCAVCKLQLTRCDAMETHCQTHKVRVKKTEELMQTRTISDNGPTKSSISAHGKSAVENNNNVMAEKKKYTILKSSSFNAGHGNKIATILIDDIKINMTEQNDSKINKLENVKRKDTVLVEADTAKQSCVKNKVILCRIEKFNPSRNNGVNANKQNNECSISDIHKVTSFLKKHITEIFPLNKSQISQKKTLVPNHVSKASDNIKLNSPDLVGNDFIKRNYNLLLTLDATQQDANVSKDKNMSKVDTSKHRHISKNKFVPLNANEIPYDLNLADSTNIIYLKNNSLINSDEVLPGLTQEDITNIVDLNRKTLNNAIEIPHKLSQKDNSNIVNLTDANNIPNKLCQEDNTNIIYLNSESLKNAIEIPHKLCQEDNTNVVYLNMDSLNNAIEIPHNVLCPGDNTNVVYLNIDSLNNAIEIPHNLCQEDNTNVVYLNIDSLNNAIQIPHKLCQEDNTNVVYLNIDPLTDTIKVPNNLCQEDNTNVVYLNIDPLTDTIKVPNNLCQEDITNIVYLNPESLMNSIEMPNMLCQENNANEANLKNQFLTIELEEETGEGSKEKDHSEINNSSVETQENLKCILKKRSDEYYINYNSIEKPKKNGFNNVAVSEVILDDTDIGCGIIEVIEEIDFLDEQCNKSEIEYGPIERLNDPDLLENKMEDAETKSIDYGPIERLDSPDLLENDKSEDAEIILIESDTDDELSVEKSNSKVSLQKKIVNHQDSQKSVANNKIRPLKSVKVIPGSLNKVIDCCQDIELKQTTKNHTPKSRKDDIFCVPKSVADLKCNLPKSGTEYQDSFTRDQGDMLKQATVYSHKPKATKSVTADKVSSVESGHKSVTDYSQDERLKEIAKYLVTAITEEVTKSSGPENKTIGIPNKTSNNSHVPLQTLNKQKSSMDKYDTELNTATESQVIDEKSLKKLITMLKNENTIRTIMLTNAEVEDERNLMRKQSTYVKASYKCTSCIIGFDCNADLQMHMLEMHKTSVGMSRCPVCRVSGFMSWMPRWKVHMDSHFQRVECVLCGVRFPDADGAARHARARHGRPRQHCVYKCLRCPYTTRIVEEYSQHKKSHPEVLPEAQRDVCPICRHPVTETETLAEHMWMAHNKLQSARCADCNKYYKSQLALDVHLKSHWKKQRRTKRVTCAYCNRRFKYKRFLGKHLKEGCKQQAIPQQTEEDTNNRIPDYTGERNGDDTPAVVLNEQDDTTFSNLESSEPHALKTHKDCTKKEESKKPRFSLFHAIKSSKPVLPIHANKPTVDDKGVTDKEKPADDKNPISNKLTSLAQLIYQQCKF